MAALKQMMEEATVFLKQEKYQQALDAARRVSQFNSSNFPALMCVGVSSFHLQLWEDAETALRRAADLKPELPAPWKNLVDVFDATGEASKKIEVLEKLVGVFRSGNKIKPSQKWTAELATTAMSVKLYGKLRFMLDTQAFDAWYTLVDEQQGLSVDAEPNDELPNSLSIWLNLMELVQLPAFNLSDATSSNVTMAALRDQFVAVAQCWNWAESSPETEALRVKTDVALALFFRFQLNQLKTATAKQSELKTLDALTVSLIQWFPTCKLAAEYLLLRSEDADSPIDCEKAATVAAQLIENVPKSPMSLMFRGFAVLQSHPSTARDLLVEGLASCSASSFHESSLCVRAQMELAAAALAARDVEGCLARLQKAQEIVADKTGSLGCASPKPSIFSAIKVQLVRARAHDLAHAFDAALDAYKNVLHAASGCGDVDAIAAATVGSAELLCSKSRADEALEVVESALTGGSALRGELIASVQCAKAWAIYLRGDVESASAILVENHPNLTDVVERARALKRLAIVYWELDGVFRTDKQTCFGSLLQAAKLAPTDGEIFGWLGMWYKVVGNDVLRAEKCFLKALSLAPLNEMAGVALSEIYELQGKTELNVSLWQNLTKAPESAPTWALLRLAQHLVDQDDEGAVGRLHLVLRNEPLNATYWVSMGHVYRHFGKLVASQRSYLRAIELGESGWCALTELARIECTLHLFEDALLRIKAASDDANAPNDIISTVHAEILFDQAKYFNGEALYGRAAANVKKAASILQAIGVVDSSKQLPVLKLLGDIQSFAFYLSPLDFADEGWIQFLARGREAYEQVVEAVPTESTLALAQAHYDVGVSCWYLARASYSICGRRFNAFALSADNDDGEVEDSAQHFETARKHLRKALELDPTFALAWNALGVVLKHPLAKQLAWIRAIQASNVDAAWANLGMLYVHHCGSHDSSRTADLARNTFLHLQAVNPNNPAMWIGYGMIYLDRINSQDHRKALEAFQCALEMGYHMDALQGFVLSALVSQRDDSRRADSQNEDELPTPEVLLFAIKKYLERESFDPLAWSMLATVQLQLGLLDQAAQASVKSLELLDVKNDAATACNNTLVSAARRIVQGAATPTTEFDQIAKALANASVNRAIIEAQKLYHSSDPRGALMSAQAALAASNSSEQQGAVASFVLALCALLVGAHGAPVKQLAESALSIVVERARGGNALSVREWESAEAYYRAAGSPNKFASALQEFVQQKPVDSGLGDSINIRHSLALVDLVEASAFTNRTSGITLVGDALNFAAVKSLLASDQSLAPGELSAPMKLVRAEPWNPAAYALAALRVYKSAALNESASESSGLKSALTLLSSGLRVAADSSVVAASSRVLLHWAYALVAHRMDPTDGKVKIHADKALEVLTTSGDQFSPVDKLLWQARVSVLVDSSAALATFGEALMAADSSTRQLVILYELGGMCEALGLLDHAHHVWKTVMSWKCLDTAALNITGFLGNLHLALVHGAKQNAKSAKKFSKTAATLASAGEADRISNDSAGSSFATTARFVESVLAKM